MKYLERLDYKIKRDNIYYSTNISLKNVSAELNFKAKQLMLRGDTQHGRNLSYYGKLIVHYCIAKPNAFTK